MLREGERPPVDRNYNNKNKSHQQHNQIIDQQEEEQEQPEWADFTSEEIKVGEKNQNKWGLTMSQDRDTLMGIKKNQQDKVQQSASDKASQLADAKLQQNKQQLEVSMDQISARQLNTTKEAPIMKTQPNIKHQTKELSKIQEQESKLGVTTESAIVSFANSSSNSIQIQQKVVDTTLKQKKQINQKLDGVFQAKTTPQNSYTQYSNPVISKQYSFQQTIPNQMSNNNLYYDAYSNQNNLYYSSIPQTSSSINPSILTPQLQQQSYYINQQPMNYSAQQQQQQQQQHQAYQYQQYMQYNNPNNIQWVGIQQQQQQQQQQQLQQMQMQMQQMQYQQQQAQNNPFACLRMNLLESARVWEYVDPQGNKQGKFTGTQMNDWLLAGYFTMDLRISCDGCTYMKLGQYLGQQTLNYQKQIQQPLGGNGVGGSGVGGAAYYYPIN